MKNLLYIEFVAMIILLFVHISSSSDCVNCSACGSSTSCSVCGICSSGNDILDSISSFFGNLKPFRLFGQMDCCCDNCGGRKKRSVEGNGWISNTQEKGQSSNDICDSPRLKKLMLKSLTNNTHISRSQIYKAIQRRINGKYVVVCSHKSISFIAQVQEQCSIQNNEVYCSAFRMSDH